MPRGEKATDTSNKRHRARKIAQSMMRRGAPRAAANQVATAMMDREYASTRTGNPRKAKRSYDEEAHDTYTGQGKTRLTTKKPAVSGARKPSTAKKPDSTKRSVKQSGRAGGAAAGRRPRAATDVATRKASATQSTTGRRAPRPRKAAGAKRRSGREV